MSSVSTSSSSDDLAAKITALTNLDLMKNTRIQTDILLKKWWFLMIVLSFLATFVVMFLLDIYLSFQQFIKWFDGANKSISNAIPGNGFSLALSYRHPFLSGIWYSNKAFPTAVIIAFQSEITNPILTGTGGSDYLQTMWQYAEGLLLQPPNQFQVCQEPTQDLEVPGCIICAAFSNDLDQLCKETCPGTNFSWTAAIGNVFGTTSMGLMTGAALAHGASFMGGFVGAGIGGLLALGLSLGTQIYEANSAKQQCVSQRQSNQCDTSGAPSC